MTNKDIHAIHSIPAQPAHSLDDVDLARAILSKLGRAVSPSREPGADPVVDMVAALIAEKNSPEIRLQTARAGAYKWGYDSLQDRMTSLGRHGWAHDCDSEIEFRIGRASEPQVPGAAEAYAKAAAAARPR